MDERLFHLINELAARCIFLDVVMIFLAKYGLPILVFTSFIFWFKKKRILIANLVSILMSWGMNQLISLFHFRARPFVTQEVNLLLSHCPDASFPSDHASVSFALAISVFFRDRQRGWFLIILATLISLARVWCGLHYPLDIIAGALLGIGIGFGIYKLTPG